MSNNIFQWAIPILNKCPLSAYNPNEFNTILPTNENLIFNYGLNDQNTINFSNPSKNELEQYISKELWRVLSIRHEIINIFNSNEKDIIPKVFQTIWFDETGPYDESIDPNLSTLNKFSLEIFIIYLIMYNTNEYKLMDYGRIVFEGIRDLEYIKTRPWPLSLFINPLIKQLQYNELLFSFCKMKSPKVVITFIKSILNLICKKEIKVKGLEEVHEQIEREQIERERIEREQERERKRIEREREREQERERERIERERIEQIANDTQPPNGPNRYIMIDIYNLKVNCNVDLQLLINNYDDLLNLCVHNNIDMSSLNKYLNTDDDDALWHITRIMNIGNMIGKDKMLEYIKYVDLNSSINEFESFVRKKLTGGLIKYKTIVPTGIFHYLPALEDINADYVKVNTEGNCYFISYFLRLLMDQDLINEYDYEYRWVFVPICDCRYNNTLTKFNTLYMILINILTTDYKQYRTNKFINDKDELLAFPSNINRESITHSNIQDNLKQKLKDHPNDLLFLEFNNKLKNFADDFNIFTGNILDGIDSCPSKTKTDNLHDLMNKYNNMRFDNINSFMFGGWYNSGNEKHERVLYKLNINLKTLCNIFKSNENIVELIDVLKAELNNNDYKMFIDSIPFVVIAIYFVFYYYSTFVRNLSNQDFINKIKAFATEFYKLTLNEEFRNYLNMCWVFIQLHEKHKQEKGNRDLIIDVRYIFEKLKLKDIWLVADINQPFITECSIIDLCLFSYIARGDVTEINEMCFLNRHVPIEYNRLIKVKHNGFKLPQINMGSYMIKGGQINLFVKFVVFVMLIGIVVYVCCEYMKKYIYQASNENKGMIYSNTT